MSLHRFHVPTAAPGARVELPEHVAHHAREVLRLRAGAAVRVFDGAGREWDAVLDEVSRRTVSARMLHAVAARAESPLRLVLAVAALKGDRMELVLQKATELGVAEIWPIVTFRTDAAARPALKGSRSERWERVASGAAEQCGRAHVPHVAPTATLRGLIERPFDGRRVALLETEGHAPLASLVVDAASPLLLLIGPAGGFEPAEADELRVAGFVAASLGPRILRAETAAVAAIAIAQSRWGDLAP
jgi:16S rRNA (uracil1498-N3)-methyltransferase